MTLLYSEWFDGKTCIDLPNIAGDWRRVRVVGHVQFDTPNAALYLLPSIDGGANWITTGFKSHLAQEFEGVAFSTSYNTSWAGMISVGVANVGKWADFEYTLFEPNDIAQEKAFEVIGGGTSSSGMFYWNRINGQIQAAPMINRLRLKPTAGTIRGNVQVYGERAEDMFPIPEEYFPIAAFGASLVGACGWPDELQTQLQALWPARKVIVRNFGRSGQNSRDAQHNIGNPLAIAPKAIILDFSAGDAAISSGISVSDSKDNMSALIAIIRDKSPSTAIFITTANPIILPGGVNFPNLPAYTQAHRDVAALEGIGLIETYSVWGSPALSQYLASDGIHPTAATNLVKTVPIMVPALSGL